MTTIEPSAEQLIGMIERIARDPLLKPAYRKQASDLAGVIKALQRLAPMSGTDVMLMLLGWHMARTVSEAERTIKQ